MDKKVLKLFETPPMDLAANRIASLYLSLCEESPIYLMATMQMLIDLLEEYDESYYIAKGIARLEESKHWLENAFEEYLEPEEKDKDVP